MLQQGILAENTDGWRDTGIQAAASTVSRWKQDRGVWGARSAGGAGCLACQEPQPAPPLAPAAPIASRGTTVQKGAAA